MWTLQRFPIAHSMANKVFPPQFHFVHFHQILNSLMHFKISILTATWHIIWRYYTFLMGSVCTSLYLSCCLMPQGFLCILFLLPPYYPLYSVSSWETTLTSPFFLKASLTLTELIMCSSLFFFRTLYMPIILHVLSYNCHVFFTKFFEVSNQLGLSWIPSQYLSYRQCQKFFVELTWIRLFL